MRVPCLYDVLYQYTRPGTKCIRNPSTVAFCRAQKRVRLSARSSISASGHPWLRVLPLDLCVACFKTSEGGL